MTGVVLLAKLRVVQFEIKRHVDNNSHFLQHHLDCPQKTVSMSFPIANYRNI